jgi:hypothetical protein
MYRTVKRPVAVEQMKVFSSGSKDVAALLFESIDFLIAPILTSVSLACLSFIKHLMLLAW